MDGGQDRTRPRSGSNGSSISSFQSPKIAMRSRRQTLGLVAANGSALEADNDTMQTGSVEGMGTLDELSSTGVAALRDNKDSAGGRVADSGAPETADDRGRSPSIRSSRLIADRAKSIHSLASRLLSFTSSSSSSVPDEVASSASVVQDSASTLHSQFPSTQSVSEQAQQKREKRGSILMSLARSLSPSSLAAMASPPPSPATTSNPSLASQSARERVMRRMSAKINERSMSHGTYLSSLSASASGRPSASSLPPHDYYHADFSNKLTCGESSSTPSLTSPTSPTSPSSSATSVTPVPKEGLSKFGSVFISALHKITAAASSGSSLDPSRHIVADISLANPTTPPPRRASINITLPLPAAPARTTTTSKAPQLNTLDITDLFPSLLPSQPLYAYRIDNMIPAPAPLALEGRLCLTDAYVFLASTDDAWTLHTWIGPHAEPDKRFCAALYAVALRAHLRSPTPICRETHGEESGTFRALFESKTLQYEEEGGAGSALCEPEEWEPGVRVYVVRGRGSGVRLCLVRPSWRELRSGRVCIVDAGSRIVQWNGNGAAGEILAKARILCAVVNSCERVGRAVVAEVDEGEEEGTILNDVMPVGEEGEEEEEEYNFADWTAVVYRVPDEGDLADIADMVVAREVDHYGFTRRILQPTDCLVLDAGTQIFLWIGRQAFSAKKLRASEILARVIRTHPRPHYLSLHRITQSHEPEPFKLFFPDWLEPGVRALQAHLDAQRTRGTPGMRVDVQGLYTAPPLAASPEDLRVLEEMRACNSALGEMKAFAFLRGQFESLLPRERGGVHVCEEGAYAFVALYRGDGDQEESEGEDGVVEDGEVVSRMNEAVAGTGDVLRGGYPVVESYESLVSRRKVEGAEGEEGKSVVRIKRRCVVYFWVGAGASRVLERTFRFHARAELQEALRALYACPVQIVHVVQGREPLPLLAHWGNRSVVHRGARERLLGRSEEQGHVFYHLRVDSRFGTSRAVEVPLGSERLVSRDCFYVHDLQAGSGFMWTGKNAGKEEERKAHAVCDRIFGFYVSAGTETAASSAKQELDSSNTNHLLPENDDTIQERSISPHTFSTAAPPSLRKQPYRIVTEHLEPRAFWDLFPTGRIAYATGVLPGAGVPRFLLCSCQRGYFCVDERERFDALDLEIEACAIVDPGAHSPVFLWMGDTASDVVRKLSLKAVEVWLETLDDGRRGWNGDLAGRKGETVVDGVVHVVEGQEGVEFRALFLGWRERLVRQD